MIKNKLYIISILFICSGFCIVGTLFPLAPITFLGLSDKFTEALGLGFGFIVWLTFFQVSRTENSKWPLEFWIFTVSFVYTAVVTVLYIALDTRSLYALIFTYHSILYFSVFYFSRLQVSSAIILEKFIRYFLFFVFVAIVLNSIVGVQQILNYYPLFDSDAGRARGLLRSTLNYSTIMVLGLAILLCIARRRGLIFYCCVLALSFGVFMSQSRAAVLGFVVMLIWFFCMQLSRFSLTAIGGLFLSIFYYAISNNYIPLERLVDGSVTSGGDSVRVAIYLSFFDKFELWGHGFGSVGSAASRFNEVNYFESYALNSLYTWGISSYGLIMALWYTIKIVSSKYYPILAGLSVVAIVQQTFETPSIYFILTNVLVYVVVCSLIHSRNVSYLGDPKSVSDHHA